MIQKAKLILDQHSMRHFVDTSPDLTCLRILWSVSFSLRTRMLSITLLSGPPRKVRLRVPDPGHTLRTQVLSAHTVHTPTGTGGLYGSEVGRSLWRYVLVIWLSWPFFYDNHHSHKSLLLGHYGKRDRVLNYLPGKMKAINEQSWWWYDLLWCRGGDSRGKRHEEGVVSSVLSQLEGCGPFLIWQGQCPLTPGLANQEAGETEQTQTHREVEESVPGLVPCRERGSDRVYLFIFPWYSYFNYVHIV
jgi:hypothetical protein